jgi:hypothetical protein
VKGSAARATGTSRAAQVRKDRGDLVGGRPQHDRGGHEGDAVRLGRVVAVAAKVAVDDGGIAGGASQVAEEPRAHLPPGRSANAASARAAI